MTCIVTTHYRYKPPPRKRKAAALEVPAIVTIDRKSATGTARKRGKRTVDAPDMTPEEHKRRGDAADATVARDGQAAKS